jgi:DNA-binding beta-propeller fold protein YncE
MKRLLFGLFFAILNPISFCELSAQDKIIGQQAIERAEVRFRAFYPSQRSATKKKQSFFGKLYSVVTGDEKGNTYVLQKPAALLAMDSNSVWIADQGTQTIVSIKDGEWNLPREFSRTKMAFQSIVGLCAFPGRGYLFTDSRLNTIYLLSGDQRSILPVGAPASWQQPTGIAFLAKKREIWVTETAAHCITVLDSLGNKIRSFGSRGTAPGNFNYPTSLWLDQNGHAYVVDALNFRVQVFDEEGTYLWSFGSSGNATGYFARPKGVALDSYGNIYVVDALFNAVQIFDQQGRFLLSFGRQGREAGEFWMPSGIYIDKDDAIYVADTYNARVQRFELCNIVKQEVKPR